MACIRLSLAVLFCLALLAATDVGARPTATSTPTPAPRRRRLGRVAWRSGWTAPWGRSSAGRRWRRSSRARARSSSSSSTARRTWGPGAAAPSASSR
ncbi:hypothetical protein ACP70R_016508 [Stipagrostis hirtigluma subsp. patula]